MKKRRIALILAIVAMVIIIVIVYGYHEKLNIQEEIQFDTKTNQHIELFGVSFQLPEEWKEVNELKSEDSRVYCDYDLNKVEDIDFNKMRYLIISVVRIDEDTVDEYTVNDEIETDKMWEDITDIKIIKIEKFTIDKHNACLEYMTEPVEGRVYDVLNLVVETKYGVLIMKLMTRNKAAKEDFNSVIQTIEFTN